MGAAKLLLLAGGRMGANGAPGSDSPGYLLRAFGPGQADIAAPLPSPLTATPGPGQLTVVDTTGLLSVSGGKLISGGYVATNDPGLYGPAIPRIAGRMVRATIKPTGQYLGVGWDIDQASWPTYFINYSGGFIYAVQKCGPGALNNTYIWVVILRATGAYYFCKGGEYTNWTLLFVDSRYNNAPLYPCINAGSVGSQGEVSDFRVPDALWLPSPCLSDSFNRADGLIGSSDGKGHAEGAAGGLGAGGGGLAWGGSWQVKTNKAVPNPTLVEQLADPGLEGTYTGGKCAGLAALGSPACVQSADAHGGSNAQQMTADANSEGLYFTTTLTPARAGQWYRLSVYAKRTAGTAGEVFVSLWESGGNDVRVAITDAAYTQKIVTTWSRNTNAIYAYPCVQKNTTGFDTVIVDDASFSELSLSDIITTVNCGTSNVLADCVPVVITGLQNGLALCVDNQADPQNYLLAYFDGTGNLCLDKVVAGVYSNLIKVATTYSAGAVLRVIKDGTSVSLYYNNALVGSTATVSDAGIINNTNHGLFSTDPSAPVDNCVIMARGNENQYQTLEGF